MGWKMYVALLIYFSMNMDVLFKFQCGMSIMTFAASTPAHHNMLSPKATHTSGMRLFGINRYPFSCAAVAIGDEHWGMLIIGKKEHMALVLVE
jgi:hypothetical protein